MQQYQVSGMSCAACTARVERAVNQVEGVTSCSVSLLTHSMVVEGNASEQQVVHAVEAAGYHVKAMGQDGQANVGEEEAFLKDEETPKLFARFFVSIVFLLMLMYLSMGHMMWGWPLPEMLAHNHVAQGLLQLLLTIIIMVINQKFFISGFRGLWHRSPNMDTLVAVGSMAAFVYSTFALFIMTDAQMNGRMDLMMVYMDEFYFESAATILTLITLGKMLEAHSKGKTTDALKSLMKLNAKTATCIRAGVEQIVPIEDVCVGDVFVVRPGETIPVDGTIISGTGAVDESSLTGESIPVDKVDGQMVYAGTLNQSGFFQCEATKVGKDTTLSQIIQMVRDAAASKAPIAKVADRVSGIFVPTVMVLALATCVIWLFVGENVGFALARAISVLVISCPCALGLATPVAIMVGNGVGARNGILFKTAVSLEQTGRAKIVALDKTGTITKGKPVVTDVEPMDGISQGELLSLAAALEAKSEHPLAKAVHTYTQEKGVEAGEVEGFQALPGNGVTATMHGEVCFAGSFSFIQTKAVVSKKLQDAYERLTAEGKTPLFFTKGDTLYGMIAVADVIKEDSVQAIAQLRRMGIHTVMLTGDNERTAQAIAKQAGVDQVVAGVLPDGKANVVHTLQEQGAVVMVGDGINDAPALTSAEVGMAIGAGTDVAMDAADVVLMRSRLSDVVAAIQLSRATLRNIHQNLFWAFFYNVIGIPLAAGVFIRVLGWQLNPMFAAAAMSLSSFCVVTNALRLNFVRLYRYEEKSNTTEQKVQVMGENTNLKKEKKEMKKTMKIEGMMCGHCEAHVKKALENLSEVTAAEVSHVSGEAQVTLAEEIPEEVLRKTVEEEGYQVVAIQ